MARPASHSPGQAADLFASAWSTADAPLDYSPASLDIVGQLVATLFHIADDAAPDRADELVRASCYMGEVVRRALGGEWASAGGGADMLRGVAGRVGDAGVVIPLSDLMLVITSQAPSLTAWYQAIALNAHT